MSDNEEVSPDTSSSGIVPDWLREQRQVLGSQEWYHSDEIAPGGHANYDSNFEAVAPATNAKMFDDIAQEDFAGYNTTTNTADQAGFWDSRFDPEDFAPPQQGIAVNRNTSALNHTGHPRPVNVNDVKVALATIHARHNGTHPTSGSYNSQFVPRQNPPQDPYNPAWSHASQYGNGIEGSVNVPQANFTRGGPGQIVPRPSATHSPSSIPGTSSYLPRPFQPEGYRAPSGLSAYGSLTQGGMNQTPAYNGNYMPRGQGTMPMPDAANYASNDYGGETGGDLGADYGGIEVGHAYDRMQSFSPADMVGSNFDNDDSGDTSTNPPASTPLYTRQSASVDTTARQVAGPALPQDPVQSASGTPPAASVATHSNIPEMPKDTQYSTVEEALKHRRRRIPFTVANDDLHNVKANWKSWVLKIMAALWRTEHNEPPEKKKGGVILTAKDKEEWKRWQGDQVGHLQIIFDMPKAHVAKEVEVIAWAILGEAINIHERGYCLDSGDPDTQSICSDRLKDAIRVLEDYAIVRYTMYQFDDGALVKFVCNPDDFVQSKIGNLWINAGKPKKEKSKSKKRKVGGDIYDLVAYLKRYTPKELDILRAKAKAKEEGQSDDAGGNEGPQALSGALNVAGPDFTAYGEGTMDNAGESNMFSTSTPAPKKRGAAQSNVGRPKKSKKLSVSNVSSPDV